MSDKKKETQGAAENQKLSTKENVLQTVKFALFSASAGIIQFASDALFNEVFHLKPEISYLISLVLSVLGISLSTASLHSSRQTMFRSPCSRSRRSTRVHPADNMVYEICYGYS